MEYILKNALALYESNLKWQNSVFDNLFLSICHYLSDTSMLVTSAIKIWYCSSISCLSHLPCILLLFSNRSPSFHLMCIDYCRSFEPIWQCYVGLWHITTSSTSSTTLRGGAWCSKNSLEHQLPTFVNLAAIELSIVADLSLLTSWSLVCASFNLYLA